jgi:hypothetical protein
MIYICRPTLIQSNEAMKCLLGSMLVVTKQDRLCHVIHATSDPFYQVWLRQLNVMQHCKVCIFATHVGIIQQGWSANVAKYQILTVCDCSKTETWTFFNDRMLPRVRERSRAGLNFEALFEVFGVKLAHWQDYITDYGECAGPGIPTHPTFPPCNQRKGKHGWYVLLLMVLDNEP